MLPDSPVHSASDEFVQRLTAAQSVLYGYIRTLLPDRTAAQDVLQQTNLTLWKKSAEYRFDMPLITWACRIAYFNVLACRRKLSRDRLVFDDTVLDFLAERQSERSAGAEDRMETLRACLEKLPSHQRALIGERYAPGGSVQRLAEAQGRTVGSISQTLYRIREELRACIRRNEHQEEIA